MRLTDDDLNYRKKIYNQQLNIARLTNEVDSLNMRLTLCNLKLNSKTWKFLDSIRNFIFQIKVFIFNKLKKQQGEIFNIEKSLVEDLHSQKYLYDEEEFEKIDTDLLPIAFYSLSLEIETNNIIESDSKNFIKNLLKQVRIAASHGIYGFCYIYQFTQCDYNLLQQLLVSKIDFPYNLCIDITKDLKFTKKSVKKLVKEIIPFLNDCRYIREDKIPIILFRKLEIDSDFSSIIHEFRFQLSLNGMDNIIILSERSIVDIDESCIDGIDGEFQWDLESANIDDYKFIYRNHCSILPYYYTCYIPQNLITKNSSSFVENKECYFLMNEVIRKTRDDFFSTKKILFFNGWNSKNYNTQLAPTSLNGFYNLNSFTRAIYGMPYDKNFIIIDSKLKKLGFINKKIAIQIHIFYLDLVEEIISYLINMPYKFDCFVTTDTVKKRDYILSKFFSILPAVSIQVDIVNNRGRDILPMLIQMKSRIKNYDYLCHIHSKKTISNYYGNRWRNYLYDSLLGSSESIMKIFYLFENTDELGMLFPSTYGDIVNDCNAIGNEDGIMFLARKLNINLDCQDFNNILFPAGSMFWAKTKSLKNLFELGLDEALFDKENGQVNATLAHAIERMFCIIAEKNGYKSLQIICNNEDENEVII